MKHTRRALDVLDWFGAALLLFVAVSSPITVPVTFQSCVSTTLPGTTLSEKNTDQIILRAEQSAEVARTTFNTFLHLERDNEAFFKKVNPQIHLWAENIRANGINWIVDLRDATKTFKATRNAENQATLNTALITLTNAVQLTQKYIADAKKVSNP